MKLTCLSENLSSAFATACRTVPSKPSLPILSNVLLQTENNRLKLSATNLETSVNLWLGVKIEEEGKVTVPARSFLEYVSSISPQKLELKTEDDKFLVSGIDTKASFVTMDPSEFPNLPEIEKEKVLQFEKEEFTKLVKKTTFAAATDEGRPVLTGVLMKVQDGKVVAVATDGFRLSEVKIKQKIETPNFSVLIPAKALLEIERLLAELSEEQFLQVSLSKDKNQIGFSFPNLEFISRLLEAAFPDYEKVIPAEFKTKARFEFEEFIKKVKVASIFARTNGQTVKLFFSSKKNLLTILGQSAQLGEQEGRLEGEIEGDDLEIAFNAKFLQDGLNSIGAEQVVFEAKDNLSPAMLHSEGEADYKHIIMPIRVESEK